jgi:hypothetical protein
MSIQHANLGIVRNGLQLYYNREFQSSFKGQSTVNLFALPNGIFGGQGNHSGSFVTTTSTGIPDLIVSGNKSIYYVPEYYTLVASGAWQSEVNRLLIYPKGGNNVALSVSTSYRLSFYARSISGNTELYYSFYGASGGRSTASLTTSWKRFEMTSTTQASFTAVEFGNKNSGFMTCEIACIQVESKSYSTPFTLPMKWTPNTTNVTAVNGGGYAAWAKTGGTNAWTDARIYSSEGITGPCYVSFKASQTNGYLMIALNNDPSAGINFTYLDYAWYITADGGTPAVIYESAVSQGSQGAYTTSTIFHIIYDGFNINYYMDGVLKRSVARTSTSPLYLDSSFYTTGGIAVNSLSFGPLEQINRTGNFIVGGGGLNDISGNNYNLDLTSTAITFDSGGFKFTEGATGPRITPVANSILDTLSNNSHSYECWVMTLGNPPDTYSGYLFGRVGFHEGFWQDKTDGKIIGAQTWYNDNSGVALSTTCTLNTWNHVVYVCDVENATRKLYKNGSLSDSSTLTQQIKQYTSTTDYIFGSAQKNYSPNLILSSAKAYNRVLSPAEIKQNFNSQRKIYGI